MTDKAFPDLQRGLAAVHQISISRKAHTTTDEAVELFRFVLEKHAQAAKPQPGSAKLWEPKPFTAEGMRKVLEMEEREHEFQARKNPKGVPIIFPSCD